MWSGATVAMDGGAEAVVIMGPARDYDDYTYTTEGHGGSQETIARGDAAMTTTDDDCRRVGGFDLGGAVHATLGEW